MRKAMLPKKRRKPSHRLGLPPGTLLPADKTAHEKVSMQLFRFNTNEAVSRAVGKNFDLKELLQDEYVTWLNIDGVHDIEILENLGRSLNIHPLVLEDIQNTNQRPKVEDHGDYFFLTMKMLDWNEDGSLITSEQVSLITGRSFVISLQEHKGDVFDSIRQRIQNGLGRIRKEGAGYLAYALLDAVVDHFFFVLEDLENSFDELEERVLFTTDSDTMLAIHHLKTQLTLAGKNIRPLREVLSSIQRDELTLVSKHVLLFFNDIQDHILRLTDSLETLREMAVSLVELHNAKIGNTMNSVMKVLTIIATIFIPLTFIAGIYGMNFVFMPELGLKWAYPVVLGVMGGVALAMVIFFRKRKWL